MDPIQGKLIWASPKPYNMTRIPDPGKLRLELTDLIHFKGEWYCTFHEGAIHGAHPEGKARIIRSSDGESWEAARTMEWEGGDIWDSRFSITAEGQLMLSGAIHFVSTEARADGHFYQLDAAEPSESDEESDVALQSATWFSSDGRDWSSAYAGADGVNRLRWDVAWHNGMGYAVGYYGKEIKGALYRTRDGKSWRVLKDNFFPEGLGNEAALAFGEDDTAYCMLRCGPTPAMLGIGKAPYYQDWTWTDLKVDFGHKDGPWTSENFFNAHFGGPKFLRLTDGRFLVAGRVRGPGRPDGKPWRIDAGDPEGKEDGRIVLFWVDAANGLLTKCLEIDGTTYPGVCEHNGMLWITYAVWWGDQPGIYLAKVKIPA